MNKFAKVDYDKFEQVSEIKSDQQVLIETDSHGSPIIMKCGFSAKKHLDEEQMLLLDIAENRLIGMKDSTIHFLINNERHSFDCVADRTTDTCEAGIFIITPEMLKLLCDTPSVDIRLSSKSNNHIDVDSVDFRLASRIIYNSAIDETAYVDYLESEYQNGLMQNDVPNSTNSTGIFKSPNALQLNKFVFKDYDKFKKKTTISSEDHELEILGGCSAMGVAQLSLKFRYVGVQDEVDALLFDLTAISDGGLDLKNGHLIFLLDDSEQIILEAHESFMSDYLDKFKKESDWYEINDNQLRLVCNAKAIDIRLTNGRDEYCDIKLNDFQTYIRRMYNGIIDNTMYIDDLMSKEERQIAEWERQQEQAKIERQRIAKEKRAQAAERARVRKQKRQEWFAKYKKVLFIVLIAIVLLIAVICTFNAINDKKINQQAVELIEQGDSFVDGYKFDSAIHCYKEALSLDPNEETKIRAQRALDLTDKKIAEANELYEANLKRLKILLEADDYVFNQYSNECLDKMIEIYPDRTPTKHFQKLRQK